MPEKSGKFSYQVRLVVTVLNEKGEDQHNQLMVGYDRFTRISNIEGNIYDAEGKLVKKLKSADIEDYGYGGSGDEITDARVKLADFGKKSYAYPYTIEYSYETRNRNLMFYPKWIPASDSRTSVERSVYTIGKGFDPSITEKLSMNVRSCATKTGTRLFVKPSLLSRSFDLPVYTERTIDFYLPLSEYDFTDMDTVSYTIPQGYKLETTLPSFKISSLFGVFESKTLYENNQLVCSRKVVLSQRLSCMD